MDLKNISDINALHLLFLLLEKANSKKYEACSQIRKQAFLETYKDPNGCAGPYSVGRFKIKFIFSSSGIRALYNTPGI